MKTLKEYINQVQTSYLTESAITALLEAPSLDDATKQKLFKSLNHYTTLKRFGSHNEQILAKNVLDKLHQILQKHGLEMEYEGSYDLDLIGNTGEA